MNDFTLEAVWHSDQHGIELSIDRTMVVAKPLPCPFDNSPDADCYHPLVGCLFVYFVGLYGLECNNGQCPAADRIDMAWTIVGNSTDLDTCQLWTIPVADPLFVSWTKAIS